MYQCALYVKVDALVVGIMSSAAANSIVTQLFHTRRIHSDYYVQLFTKSSKETAASICSAVMIFFSSIYFPENLQSPSIWPSPSNLAFPTYLFGWISIAVLEIAKKNGKNIFVLFCFDF